MRQLISLVAFGLLCTLLFHGDALGKTYYVDSVMGNDLNDGSRSRPWKTITHSLTRIGGSGADPTNPATLEVAPGNYSATSNGEAFPLVISSYTTLTGGGIESTILNAEGNAAHVILLDGVTGVVLEDLALTGGAASGVWPDACGGGLCVLESEVTVRTCKMYSNSAAGADKLGAGAGIYLYGECSPYIYDCHLEVNTAATGGAGICCEYKCTPKIENCRIEQNTGTAIQVSRECHAVIKNCSIMINTGGGLICQEFSSIDAEGTNIATNTSASGAGVSCHNHCSVRLDNCTLWHNEATSDGGAVWCQRGSECSIIDCKISENTARNNGGGICCTGADLEVIGTDLFANEADNEGGGVLCATDATTVLDDCNIAGNRAKWGAGLAFCDHSGGSVTSSLVSQNEASVAGAGIFCRDDSSPAIKHCEVLENAVGGELAVGGAGLYCEYYSHPSVRNCLIVNNTSDGSGAGLFCRRYCDPTLSNCTIWDNTTADEGASISCEHSCEPSLESCIVWGGEDGIFLEASDLSTSYSCIRWGGQTLSVEGDIDQDPVFAVGPTGDYYLSSTRCKESEDSPCIDAGEDTSEDRGLSFRTTRTDEGFDTDEVDLGYHYPAKLANIRCLLNASHFYVGEDLELSIRIENPADKQVALDVYVAVVLPNGMICCIKEDGGIGCGLFPWQAGFSAPSEYVYGPECVLQLQVFPGCPSGGYLAVGALFAPQSMDSISEMSMVAFSISE